MIVLKDLVPPLIIRKLRDINTREYPDYESAKKVCRMNAYENDILCNCIVEKTINYRNSINNTEIKAHNSYLLSALLYAMQQLNKDTLNVLDFGGAAGAHYFEISNFLPKNITLKWNVVETGQMASLATKLGNKQLQFFENINQVPNPDFIYSSCALHYVPDTYKYLNLLLNIKAPFFMLDRMHINLNNKDFVVVQKSTLTSNGPGGLPKGYNDMEIFYPRMLISDLNVKNAIQQNYNLQWIFNLNSETFKINKQPIVTRGYFAVLKK
jgi:putative methyltransferase (TIGR04325 family)